MELSLKVPVAVNCCDPVRATEGDAGVTAIEVRVGGFPTVKFVLPVIDPDVAPTTLVPLATALANPEELIVDTALLLELQTTELVRFCVLPSLYVPVAVNCWLVEGVMVELAGVTAIETRTGALTVKDVAPLTGPDVAVMVVAPMDAAVAMPPELMLATEVAEEVQITLLLRFCIVPLL
jgi:hypothetical protein